MNKNKANRKKQPKSSKRDPNLQLHPAFPGQYMTAITIPGITFPLSTTVTTGVIAATYPCDPTTTIQNWATRFGVTFKEYRVIKALLKVKMFSSTLPGQMNAWVDETLTSAPTQLQALEFQGITTFPAGNNERTHVVKWVPHSTTELAYVPLATASTNAAFKVYTDNAVFGSSIVATAYCTFQTVFSIQFRGLA